MNHLSEVIDKVGIRSIARRMNVGPSTVHLWKRTLPGGTGTKAVRRENIEVTLAEMSGLPLKQIKDLAAKQDRERDEITSGETLSTVIDSVGLSSISKRCLVGYNTAVRWKREGLPSGPEGSVSLKRRRWYEVIIAKSAGIPVGKLREITARDDKLRGKGTSKRKVDMGTASGAVITAKEGV